MEEEDMGEGAMAEEVTAEEAMVATEVEEQVTEDTGEEVTDTGM